MLVRIRFSSRSKVRGNQTGTQVLLSQPGTPAPRNQSRTQVRVAPRKPSRTQQVALAVAALITPAALVAFVFAFWRLTADLKIVGAFPIAGGFFSHWQIWLAAAAVLEFLALLLSRYGKTDAVLPETIEEPAREFADSRFYNVDA
jgi:hypothetical protein